MWRAISTGVRAMLFGSSSEPSQSADEVVRHADLDPGEAVGEYVVVKKLGEGGFGTVYEAAHPVIGKRAAVKVLHAQYSSDEDVTSRFVAEARAVNQIRHRNIVDIFGFGDLPDGRHYYVMELLDGAPLDTYLDRAGRLSPSEALPLLHTVAKALGAAHAAGIAHRDLKPENVFLEIDDEGCATVKILDFGIAKLLAPGVLATHKTRSGVPMGSPRYMSPEQCRGVQVDHRTDVYAFGCMAYRMLTGVPPFEARTALELMMTHVSIPPSAPSLACADLPREFDEPILKMLEKEPDARPSTMMAAFESLAAAAERSGHDPLVAAAPASTLLKTVITERRGVGPTALDVSKRPRASTPAPPVRKKRPLFLTSALAIGFLTASILAVWALRTRQSTAAAIAAAAASLAAAAPHAGPIGPPASSVQPYSWTASTASAPSDQSRPSTRASHPAGGGQLDGDSGSAEQRLGPGEHNTISVTVSSQPPHADVFWNDEKLGVAPGPIQVPRDDTPKSLVVRAPGYAPSTVTVQSTTDTTVHVVLSPSNPRPTAPRPARAPSVSRDLEDPY